MEPNAESTVITPDAAKPLRREIRSWGRDLLIALSLAVVIIVFFYQPVKVEGTSMTPLISDQERIFINKFVYRFEPIERGDVVVFWYPLDRTKSFIKRVVGLPGDTVEIRRGRVFVNGSLFPEPYISPEALDSGNLASTRIPPGEYFVMGDHRTSSNDSRIFGPVARTFIYGKAVFAYWPVDHFGSIPVFDREGRPTRWEEPLTDAVVRPGILALEDGRIFNGRAAGANTRRGGEVVFNTSLTGYQEVFTDPSYQGQIVCLTYPHIGNVGTNLDDEESVEPHIESLVVREFSSVASNWRSSESAQNYLSKYKIPVLWDIDTRALVRHIRQMGALRGVVATDGTPAEKLVAEARALPKMTGQELASRVTTEKQYAWDRGSIELTASPWQESMGESLSHGEVQKFRVVAYDFGIKQNILRLLVDHNCDVTVVPAKTSAEDALALKPDGVFLSNGPGDPEPATYAIENIRKMLGRVPIFGICLGHQLCGLALGGNTFKLRFGHHGSNHPVKNLLTGQVEITAQNHGFCVDPDSLPSSDVEVTHLNLNDQTNEGLRHRSLPLFSVQYHPEASPGPHDSHYLFNQFIATMNQWKLSGALRRGQAKA